MQEFVSFGYSHDHQNFVDKSEAMFNINLMMYLSSIIQFAFILKESEYKLV